MGREAESGLCKTVRRPEVPELGAAGAFHREEISGVLECLPTSAFSKCVWGGKGGMGSTPPPKGTLLCGSVEPKDGSWGFELPSLGSGAPVCLQIFQ